MSAEKLPGMVLQIPPYAMEQLLDTHKHCIIKGGLEVQYIVCNKVEFENDLRALITQAIELARENAYVEYCPDEYAPCHEVHYADTTAEILSKLLGEK